jgi:heme/copper-type cytochrome/quinol oxidase subunit 2
MERPADAPAPGVIPVERGRVIYSWALAMGIALIMFGLAFSTISATDAIEKPPTDRAWDHHNVTGFQFGWKYNYTGPGGIPFQRIGEWTVPADTVVVLNVTSQDVWHNFAIPDFRIRVDAIPGEVNALWFEAREARTFSNVCVQICGSSHALMKTTMHVVPPAEYEAWLARESAAEYAKLASNVFKDPKRGTVVNATVGGADVSSSVQQVGAGRPVLFNVTNAGASPLAVTASGGGASSAVSVPAGQSAYLWLQAPASGEVALSTSSGQSAKFQVVS